MNEARITMLAACLLAFSVSIRAQAPPLDRFKDVAPVGSTQREKVCNVGISILPLLDVANSEVLARRDELLLIQRELRARIQQVAASNDLNVFENVNDDDADVQIILTFSPKSGKGQGIWYRDGDNAGDKHKLNAWYEKLKGTPEERAFMKSKGWDLQDRPISTEDVLHAVTVWHASGSHSLSASIRRGRKETEISPVKPSDTNYAKEDSCPYHELSQTFRDVAGDAFDKLQSLESGQLEGKIYYQPAYQQAGPLVLKVGRIASGQDEVNLSSRIATYYYQIDSYRLETQIANMNAESPTIAALNPNAYKDLAQTKEEEQKSRLLIEACLTIPTREKKQNSNDQPAPREVAHDTGKLLVTSSQGNAEIFVDGAYIGNVPASLKLSSGTHTVRVALRGYKEQTKNITVLADSELRLVFDLEKQRFSQP